MMKIRLFGTLTCIIFILSIIPMVEANSNEQEKNPSIIFDDDVPVWEVGNSWKYTIENFSVARGGTGKVLLLNGKIDDLEFTVSDTTGDYYKVDVTGKINAYYEIYYESALTIYITGTFTPSLTRFKGTITFKKTNLEVSDFSANIIGITKAKISPIPVSFPIPIKLSLDGDFSTSIPILDFPLYDFKIPWSLPELNVETNAKFGGIFGLIKIPITIITRYDSTIAAFWCLGENSISVDAGTFSSWRISNILFDFFEYYYAPSVKNLVKINFDMNKYNYFNGELKDTNIPH